MGRKAQDGVCHDVGGDDVVGAGGLVGQIADQHLQLVVHPVQGGVLTGGAHAHGVDVHALGLGRAQLQGRDGQNAGPGADVQHPLDVYKRQHPAHPHTGRGVHPGLDLQSADRPGG